MKKPFINEKVLKEFEPVYTKAELEIKGLIRDYVLQGRSIRLLTEEINKRIKQYKEALPKELPNHESYVNALAQSSTRWLQAFVSKIEIINVGLLAFMKPTSEIKPIEPIRQLRAINFQGSPRVDNYYEELIQSIRDLAEEPLIDEYEPKKRRMSLFAKAELDLRHQNQLDKIGKLKGEGKVLRRITTHASASKRCEKWQGKLLHLELPPINQSMETGMTYQGEKVYSFVGITNKLDKYGYKNNVLVGFNCRHDTIDPNYTDNIEKYSKSEIEQGRKVNAKQRSLEANIRQSRKNEYLALDKKEKALWRKKARLLTKEYEAYSKQNRVAMAKWRLHIPMDMRKVANY